MINPADILTAASSEQALEDRIAHQAGQIAAMLAPYELRSAVYAWFDSLRAIEEFINLITVDWDDDDFERRLFSLPVGGLVNQLDEFKEIRQRMVARFGENFGIRFTNLLIQGSAIAVSFETHGALDVAAGFHTVGTMVGYLQSRRRHFVGLLHILPTACRGSQVIACAGSRLATVCALVFARQPVIVTLACGARDCASAICNTASSTQCSRTEQPEKMISSASSGRSTIS